MRFVHHRCGEGQLSSRCFVSRHASETQWILRMAVALAIGASAR